jgi:two-component system response regulator RegA
MDGHRVVRTILVVEDDQLLLAAYKRTFEHIGALEVVTATNVAIAKRLARKHRPDLCVVDMQLGCESGIELIKELRAHDRDLQIVLVTGHGSLEAGAEAVRAGADHVMAKPAYAKEILERVHGGSALKEFDPMGTATKERCIWEHAQRVLRDCDGNRSEAARRLGVDRGTLQRWLDAPAPRR